MALAQLQVTLISWNFSEADGATAELSLAYPNSHKPESRGKMWGLSVSFSEKCRLKAVPSKGLGWGRFLGTGLSAQASPRALLLVPGGHPSATPILCGQPAAAQYLPHGHGHCGLLPAPREW